MLAVARPGKPISLGTQQDRGTDYHAERTLKSKFKLTGNSSLRPQFFTIRTG